MPLGALHGFQTMSAKFVPPFSSYEGGVDHFAKRLTEMANGYGEGYTPVRVFEDFLEAAYCSISKVAWASLLQFEKAEAQEARFAALAKVRKPGWLESLGEFIGIAATALSFRYGDFFGEVAGRIGSLSSSLGQFFTPYSLCQLMVSITLPRAHWEETLRKDKLITISEPASGGGAQLVAVADAMVQGIKEGSPLVLHRDVYIEAIDVSELAFKMTYITTSLCGLSACVRHGNTLTREVWDTVFTPTFLHLYSNPAFLARITSKKKATSLRPENPHGPSAPFGVMRRIGAALKADKNSAR